MERGELSLRLGWNAVFVITVLKSIRTALIGVKSSVDQFLIIEM